MELIVEFGELKVMIPWSAIVRLLIFKMAPSLIITVPPTNKVPMAQLKLKEEN